MDQRPTINCPNCGYAVEVGTATCGNCGHQIGDQSTQPGQNSNVTTPPPDSGRSGAIRRFVVVVALSVVVSLIGAAAGAIYDFVANSDSGERSGAVEEVVPEKVDSPYTSVRAVAVALNEGGLHCKKIKVDHDTEVVTTGSCQVPGKRTPLTHVQINIFFEKTGLDAVEDQMKQDDLTYVHDANWFVITLNPIARQVQKILGGELSLAK